MRNGMFLHESTIKGMKEDDRNSSCNFFSLNRQEHPGHPPTDSQREETWMPSDARSSQNSSVANIIAPQQQFPNPSSTKLQRGKRRKNPHSSSDLATCSRGPIMVVCDNCFACLITCRRRNCHSALSTQKTADAEE